MSAPLTRAPARSHPVSGVHYVSYFDFGRAPQALRSRMPDPTAKPPVKIQTAK